MTYLQLDALTTLNQTITNYHCYKDIYNTIINSLGTGEFTRKDYNSKMPIPYYLTSPSPSLDSLRKKGIIKVVRQENFTIEIEDEEGTENFAFELSNGRVLTEEEFCAIPLKERLKMSVKVKGVKGKKKIETVRYYYQLNQMSEEEMKKKCADCLNILLD